MYQFERNTDKEKLQELLNDEAVSARTDNEICCEAPASDNDVEKIPAVCAETMPPKAIESYQSVEKVYSCDH